MAPELEPNADLVAAAAEVATDEATPDPVKLERARAAYREAFPPLNGGAPKPAPYGSARRHVGNRPALTAATDAELAAAARAVKPEDLGDSE